MGTGWSKRPVWMRVQDLGVNHLNLRELVEILKMNDDWEHEPSLTKNTSLDCACHTNSLFEQYGVYGTRVRSCI